jgi:hypothetical protein
VVLMGPDRDSAHYIGALDGNWHVIHYVELPGGGNTASLLRALPKFWPRPAVPQGPSHEGNGPGKVDATGGPRLSALSADRARM